MISILLRKLRRLSLLLGTICPFPGLRISMLRFGGIEIARDAYVNMFVSLLVDVEGGATVRIGERTAVAPGVVFAAISGGNKARVGEHYPEQRAAIHVGDDVWIGANATIFAGVTIGAMSVIGANSVVNRDVPPGSVVAGAPARLIRKLPD